MCGPRQTFANRTIKWFSGATEFGGTQVTSEPAKVYAEMFPDRKWGIAGGYGNDHISIDYAIKVGLRLLVSKGSPVRPITRIVEYRKLSKPTVCDARCRNARGPMCDCSCGGMNHGLSVSMSRMVCSRADIDLTPTEEMASNAARGLELREKHGRGGTAVGVARARDIKNRKNLSPDTVRRMHSFFSRHAGNEAGGEDDAGYISFLLWGGAAGRSWAKRKSAQLDKDENAMSDTRKEIMERLGMAGKVKSGRAEQVMRDGTVHLDFRAAKEWLAGVTDSALRYIINDAQQAAKAMPDGNKWNYYHDLSLTAQDELQRRKRKSARPGAKAAFSVSDAEAYERGVKMSQMAALIPNFREGVQANPWFQLGYQMGVKHGPKAGAMMSQAKREFPAVAARLNASRPGAKAKMAMTDVQRKAGYKWRVAYTKQLGKDQYLGGPPVTIEDDLLFATESAARQWADAMLKKGWFKGQGGGPEKVMKATVLMASRPGKSEHFENPKFVVCVMFGGRTVFQTAFATLAEARSEAKKALAKYGDLGNEYLPHAKGTVEIKEYRGANLIAQHRFSASRPGAKAKMAKPQFRVRKLHGGYLAVDMNQGSGWERYDTTHEEVFDGLEDYERGYQKAYDRGLRWSGGSWRIPSTKASRPGAKAKMGGMRGIGDWAVSFTNIIVERLPELRKLARDLKASIKVSSPSPNGYVSGTITRKYGSSEAPDLMASGKVKSMIQSLGGQLDSRLAGFSRPGAKAHNAADILKVEVMDGSTVTSSMTPSDFMAYAKRSLPGIASTSSLPDMIARFNELAEEKGMRVRVRSNLAKSKNAIREGEKVSASDDAVSRKIRKLMDEGKPQKQAVAIALDLERRGEL